MKVLSVGICSLAPDVHPSCTVSGLAPAVFTTAFGEGHLITESDFSTIFPGVTQLTWVRGACKPWSHGEEEFIHFPHCFQQFLMHKLGPVTTLKSVQLSLEEDTYLNDNHTTFLASSVRNLTLVTISGEISQLVQCVEALPIM